jgi:hypothetical protein
MAARRMKIVYLIGERIKPEYCTQIGLAFVDSDGAMHVKLEAIPLSGELLICDYAPKQERAAGEGPSAPPAAPERRRLGPIA